MDTPSTSTTALKLEIERLTGMFRLYISEIRLIRYKV